MITPVYSKNESCRVTRDYFLVPLALLMTAKCGSHILRFTTVQALVVIILHSLLAVANCAATTDIYQELKRQSSHTCNSLDLHIENAIVEDIHDICTAGLAVASFYRDMGLPKVPTMHVKIIDNIPPEVDANVLGCFAPENQSIQILSFLDARKCGNWFGRHIDRALYQSLAAHEIAHAFASCNASVNKLSVRAGEYVAYVTMFATMDHNLRREILEGIPGIGYENEEQISDTYYYLSPDQFGVNAYRHFLRPENGVRFFQSVIRGQTLLE